MPFITLVGCNSGSGVPVQVGEDSPASNSQDTLVAYFGPCDLANLGSQIWPENSISVYTCMRCGCNIDEQVLDVNNMNAWAQCPQNTQNAFYKWVNGEYQDWECIKPSNNPLYPVPTNPSTTSSESMARETGWVSSSSERNGSFSSEKASSSSVSYLNPNISYSTMRDGRDGQIYATVTIGNYEWMAQNLNYNLRSESWCYEDDAVNCAKYGRLYTRGAALSVCLPGWHLPTKEEWENLFDAVGGQSTAGNALRSLSGWEDGGSGIDTYGFSAIAAGENEFSDLGGGFRSLGKRANFWSSTKYNEDSYGYFLYCVHLLGGDESVDLDKYGGFYSGYSVRCVRDYATNSENSLISSSSLSPTTNSSSSSFTQTMSYGILVDARDGQSYKTVVIGDQTWMAENLNYESEKSYCYDDDLSNCDIYGRLYEWWVAKDVCPKGWSLPSKSKWETLFAVVGGMLEDADENLKSASGWFRNGNGTDDYGFSVLPAGCYRYDKGFYIALGKGARFWTSTGDDSDFAFGIYLAYSSDVVTLNYFAKDEAQSVRCVKD